MASVVVVSTGGCRGGSGGAKSGGGGEEENERQRRQRELSLLAAVLAALRRSVVLVGCRMEKGQDSGAGEEAAPLTHMDIGWPTDVRHVAHVTFDRFHGFLGLPVEFELEIPCRVPSASASVFGVSAESMQCCYDSKGNSVPTILLLMQERLYQQGGLKAEGIFRINPENGQEEDVRDQLNKGVVPDNIDVHCLAGLIKAWFRELPEGVLDGLSPEQVLNCNSEEECVELVQQLLPMQHALLNWAVELMTDVVEEEELNKMNARNIAMVFAPNMTQMSDPLTALMHAVQVMNLLKTLILKTLREREEATMDEYSSFLSSPTSDRQVDDDDELNGQKDTEMSGELRRSTSDDDRSVSNDDGSRGNIAVTYYINHCNISEDEDESEKEIEDCFLRGLEWKQQVADDQKISNCCSPECESKQGSLITDDAVVNVKSMSDRIEGENQSFEFRMTP